MANVSCVATPVAILGTQGEGQLMLGYVSAVVKAAQNDTITVRNAASIQAVLLYITATGASEANTVSGNVITLTSVTGGTVTGLILFTMA